MKNVKNIKQTVNALLSTYLLNRDLEKNIIKTCAEKLFALVYCNPETFGIVMKEDDMSDFLTFLYPNTFQNIFEKYDESRSNFFTFVCACLKYQKSFFMKHEFKRKAQDAILLQEFKRDIENEFGEFYEFDYNKCLRNYTFPDAKMPSSEDMTKTLEKWRASNAFGRGAENVRKLIFLFACKSAPFVDDILVYKISKYIGMPFELLSYYILVFNVEFLKCNKEIMAAKEKSTKYFVRKISFEKILKLDYSTENQKCLIMKSLKYSEQKYEKANHILQEGVKCVSNRTIAKITGFSRSSIDRLFMNASYILSGVK